MSGRPSRLTSPIAATPRSPAWSSGPGAKAGVAPDAAGALTANANAVSAKTRLLTASDAIHAALICQRFLRGRDLALIHEAAAAQAVEAVAAQRRVAVGVEAVGAEDALA